MLLLFFPMSLSFLFFTFITKPFDKTLKCLSTIRASDSTLDQWFSRSLLSQIPSLLFSSLDWFVLLVFCIAALITLSLVFSGNSFHQSSILNSSSWPFPTPTFFSACWRPVGSSFWLYCFRISQWFVLVGFYFILICWVGRLVTFNLGNDTDILLET